MSFEEQAQWVHDQDVIIAPHGAQNVNFMWCRRCTVVVEIFPRGFYMPGEYLQLARSAGAVVFAAYDGANPLAETAAETMTYMQRLNVRDTNIQFNLSLADTDSLLRDTLGALRNCRAGVAPTAMH